MEFMNEIRCFLYEETGIIMTVAGLLLSSLVMFNLKKQTMKRIAFVSFALTFLLGTNYADLKWINPVEELYEVPNVTNMSFSNAQFILRNCGFIEHFVGHNDNILSYEESSLVYRQDPIAGTKVPKGTSVILSAHEIEIIGYENSKLSINIIEYTVGDGFYYQYPDPEDTNSTIIIDFGKGIFGTYEYSRNLNEIEKDNYLHGGRLCDANGNEIGEKGNYPSFWSNSEGMFAVEFPKGLKAGVYTYELYQYINGQYVSDSIDIEIK